MSATFHHVVNFDLRGFARKRREYQALVPASVGGNKLRARKRRKGISTSVMPSRLLTAVGREAGSSASADMFSKPVRVRSSRPLKLLMLMTCVQPARDRRKSRVSKWLFSGSFTLVSKQVSKRRQVKMGEMPMLEGKDA